jgi:hypothetical protein
MYVLFIDDCDMIYSADLADCFDCLIKYAHKFKKFVILNGTTNDIVMEG